MAELFGMGKQQPAPKRPWDEMLRRENEISPLVKLLEESGSPQAAALTKANISPQEKSVIAKMLAQSGGGGGEVNQLQSLSDMLAQSKNRDELGENYAKASSILASLPDDSSRITGYQKALEITNTQTERKLRDAETQNEMKKIYSKALDLVDRAPKSAFVGNLRQPIAASNSDDLNELIALGTKFVGMETQAEGGKYGAGVRQINENYKRLVGQIGHGTGVDPESFKGSLRGAMEAAGFSDIVSEVDQEREGAKGNMSASSNTIAPSRTEVPSLGKWLGDNGYYGSSVVGAIEGVMNNVSNISNLITAPLRIPVNFALGTNIGAARVESTPESTMVENGLMLAESIATVGALSPALGVVGAVGATAAAPLAYKGGSKVAGKAYDMVSGAPETESAANRKQAVEELGGFISSGGLSMGIKNYYQGNARRAAQPSGAPPRPPGGKPEGSSRGADKGFDVDITPKSPVATKLETIGKYAGSSGAIAATIRNANGMIPKEMRERVVRDSMTNADMVSMNLSSLGKSVEGSEIALGRLSVAKDLERAISSNSEEAFNREAEYQSAVKAFESMDPLAPERATALDAMRAAEHRATSAWAGLNQAIEGSASISNAIIGSATANDNPSLSQEQVQKALVNAINTGSRVPDHYPLTSKVIGEAQGANVSIPRTTNPQQMLRDNVAEAKWRGDMAIAEQQATDKARSAALVADRRAYNDDRASKEAANAKAIADNLDNVNGVIDTSLGVTKAIRNDTDLANKLYKDLNDIYQKEMAPLSKRYEALDKKLARIPIPEEALEVIKDSATKILDDIEQSKLLSTESTKAVGMLNKIIDGEFDNLLQLQRTVREIRRMANYESPQGDPQNVVRITSRPLEEGIEEAFRVLVEAEANLPTIAGKKRASNKIQQVADESKSLNEAYRGVKDRLSNPAINRLRSNKADSATAALNALTANPEEFGRLSAALGRENSDMKALLARKIKQDLEPSLRSGDKQAMDARVDQWDSESMPSLPAGLARTIKAIPLHQPQHISDYRARDISGLRADPREWFKNPPASVRVEEMSDDEVWGLLGTMEGTERFLANTPDTIARRELLAEHAVSVLNTGNAKKHRIAFALRAMEHKGFEVSESDPLSMASRWEDVIKGSDAKKRALVRKQLGEETYKETVKWVESVAKDANDVVNARNVTKYALSTALHPRQWLHGMVNASIAAFRQFVAYKAKKRLEREGIETKKKKSN